MPGAAAPRSVVVRAPATVANLGPGFDCVGIALAWHNEIQIAPADETTITVAGPGGGEIPTDERNLVLRAVRSWERAAGLETSGVRIHLENQTPYGRGFGSSAASIVGGLVGARALFGGEAPILQLAYALEGHLDNLTACLRGGITISGYSTHDALRIEPPAGVTPLVCVSPVRLSTTAARAVLPETVPFSEAVFTATRAALLAACLATGDVERLLAATEDRLHQDRRFDLAPESGELVRGLRKRGVAAFLAGAGPSVAALVPEDRGPEAEQAARDLVPEGWQVRLLSFDSGGAVISLAT